MNYTIYNTEGYTQSQLDQLNALYAAAPIGEDDDNELQGISERILSEFDSTLAC